jgi:hypothetical protein
MTDIVTGKSIEVLTSEVGPYVLLPASQIKDVERLLKDSNVRHWVDELAVSLNNGPYIGKIWLGRGGDAARVQALLDSFA